MKKYIEYIKIIKFYTYIIFYFLSFKCNLMMTSIEMSHYILLVIRTIGIVKKRFSIMWHYLCRKTALLSAINVVSLNTYTYKNDTQSSIGTAIQLSCDWITYSFNDLRIQKKLIKILTDILWTQLFY